MEIQNSRFLSIEQVQDQYLNQTRSSTPVKSTDGKSFQEILESRQLETGSEVKFSKHASGRLAERNIRLTENQMDRLTEGAKKAGAKGIKESLVIVDQFAFIVNVPNHTVVTAMDQTEADENVFTNIDGAVIM